MHEWDIDIDATSESPLTEDRVDALIDDLTPFGAVASYSPTHLGLSMTVEAATLADATARAFAILTRLSPALQVIAIRAARPTADQLDAAS